MRLPQSGQRDLKKKKKNHQYHLSTAHKIVAVLEKTQEEEQRGKSICPYATRLGKFGHGYGRNGI